MIKLILGCGYLGRRVARLWRAQGHQVFGTTRTVDRAEELRQMEVEPILYDVLQPASLDRLPAAKTILYCVGFDRHAGQSMREVYVGGLDHFLNRYRPIPDRLIYISSTGVYGQFLGEEVDETAVTEPTEESGQVVLAAEERLRAQPEWPAVILRFAGIYGPDRLIRRQSIENGEPLIGDPDKWLNLIHVDDGAAAVLAAEARGEIGSIYNVSDDRPVRRRDFYQGMAQLLGAPEPHFVPPSSGAPRSGHEVSNRRTVNRRLHEDLGIQLRFPSFAEGLSAFLP